jgi:hypothetical protein
MSPELLSNILFGAAMFVMGLYALYQNHRFYHGQGKLPSGILCYN